MGWIKRVLQRITPDGDTPRVPRTRAETGRMGERVAADFLVQKGYRILERNFTVLHGEIDIIAFLDGGLVFVEVRSQRHAGPRDPAESVDRRKRECIIKAAHCYIARRPVRVDAVTPQFDVISVRFDPAGAPPVINHIPNAFATTRGAFS